MATMDDLMNEFEIEMRLQESRTQIEQIEDFVHDEYVNGDFEMEMYDEDDDVNTDIPLEIQCVQANPLATRTEFDIRGSLEGMRAGSWEELEQLYHDHSRATGFSVRKSTIRKTNGVVHERYFVCSKQGTTEIKTKEPEKQSSKRKLVPTKRCGCDAHIRMKLDVCSGEIFVKQHVVSHNHALARVEWQYLQRSERTTTLKETMETIEGFEDAHVRPTTAYRYLAKHAGGTSCVGHTLRDHLNYVNRMRMKEIEGGDAQTVIKQLIVLAQKDNDFYWNMKLDDDAKLVALFWCDSLMKEDFKIYGDVVIFDTTYCTNKYNLICAPIVGINNHWNTTMFGCAFIADEKVESFVWVLEQLKEAMDGKNPVSIFTDQDAAIARAVEQVYPFTRHRLCLWHILKNAVSHYGSLKSDANFKDAFNKCLMGCSNENEFNKCWEDMVESFKLKRNKDSYKWFDRLYNIKDKWCTALSKDFFSAGILSSQRSESTNNAIGFEATKSTNLYQFFKIFQKTIERWREREIALEFYCTTTTPTSAFRLTGLLRHASEIYTATLFRDFEQEFKMAIASSIELLVDMGDKKKYSVWFDGYSDVNMHEVQYTKLNDTIHVDCTCKNFESNGWLCCHCLRVLHLHSVQKIPFMYILPRWTKNAKKEIWDTLYGSQCPPTSLEPPRISTITWRQGIGRKFYNLVLKSQSNEEARKVVETLYKAAIDEVNKITEKNTNEIEGGAENSQALQLTQVRDPQRTITKGRKKRLKGHFETSQKKGSSSAQRDTANQKRNKHLI